MKKVMAREKKEFDEEVLQIDRVTRVVKGGRRLRFRATVIIGDRKGRVGMGIGKATEVASSIQKGISRAKKSLIKLPHIKNNSIPFEIKIKYKSALILLMPASSGTGIVAGGATRKILDLAGIKNVFGKSFRSNNRLVCAQATMKALNKFTTLELKQRDIVGKKEKNNENNNILTANKPKEKPIKTEKKD